MKISKKLLLYIGMAAWLFVAGIMGYAIYSQMDEQSTIDAQITTNQGLMASMTSADLENQKQALQAESDDLKTEAETLKTRLVNDRDNVVTGEKVFQIAHANNVQVISLNAPAATDDYLINIPSEIIVVQTTVEGDVADLLDFITELNSTFDTGMIQEVEITVGESGNVTPTASVLLELYNYQGE